MSKQSEIEQNGNDYSKESTLIDNKNMGEKIPRRRNTQEHEKKSKNNNVATILLCVLLGIGFIGGGVMFGKYQNQQESNRVKVVQKNEKKEVSNQTVKIDETIIDKKEDLKLEQSSKELKDLKDSKDFSVKNKIEEKEKLSEENSFVGNVDPKEAIIEDDLNEPIQQNNVSETEATQAQELDPVSELKRMEEERLRIEEERKAFQQKEKEMAEKIERMKKIQEDKARSLMLEKAQKLKEQKLKDYSENIESLKSEVEKVHQEQQLKEKAIADKINATNTLFEKQIAEYEAQNNFIEEQEKKLAELKKIQKQNEEQIKLNYARDIQKLEKQKEELEKESKVVNKETISSIEKQIVQLNKQIEDLNKTSTEQLVIKNLDEIKKELPVQIDLNNLKIEEKKKENKDVKEVKEEVLAEPTSQKSEDKAEEKSNYENNLKDAIINKEVKNGNSEWINQSILKNEGKYEQYGTWLEVKFKNKL